MGNIGVNLDDVFGTDLEEELEEEELEEGGEGAAAGRSGALSLLFGVGPLRKAVPKRLLLVWA